MRQPRYILRHCPSYGGAIARHWAVAALVACAAAVGALGPAAAAEGGSESANNETNSRFAELWTGGTKRSEAELLALAHDPDPLVRQFAALQLAELDPPTEAAVAALLEALGDKTEIVRFQALAGLMRLGRPATHVLAETLSDFEGIAPFAYYSEETNGERSLTVSRSDLSFAALLHADGVAVDALLDAHQRVDRGGEPAGPVPSGAAEETIRSPMEPAEIRELLRNETVAAPESELVRERIRMVLDRAPVELTPDLLSVLAGDDVALKVAAARMIGRAGAEAVEAVPLLARAVADDDDAVRQAAAYALAEIPEAGPEALGGLLSDSSARARQFALAAYPVEAGGLAEAVARLLEDADPDVRRVALDRMRDPDGPRYEFPYYYSDSCRSAVDGQPPSRLLTEFPGSALSHVLDSSNDQDERMRAAALVALASLGCARTDLAPAVADALLTKLADPVEEIASAAANRLAALAELGTAPRSPGALDEVLAALADPAAEDLHEDLLKTLEPMELPHARQEELIDALLTACLASGYPACERVEAILLSRPGWSEAALQALIAHYPDLAFDNRALELLTVLGSNSPVYSEIIRELLDHPETFDERDLEVLATYGSNSPIYTEALWKLLDHPKRRLRVSAAMLLAEHGEDLRADVWDTLAEGLRFEDFTGWEGHNFGTRIADALAGLGEPGIERIATIVEDSATSAPTRELLIGTLAGLANESPRAADLILATAAGAALPWLQREAIWAVGSIDSRSDDVRGALEAAFTDVNVDVRKAVVYEWRESGLPPGDLVERAFGDPAPDVRSAALALLARLPEDDHRRVAITKAGLQDEDENVRNQALQDAGALGEAGSALLAEYAARGEPLSYGFFSGVQQLRALDAALVAALEARAVDASPDVRASIDDMLRTVAPVDPERLYARLKASDPAERASAARALLSLNEDPWTRDGLIAAVLMDAEVRRIVEERLGVALDLLYPYSGPVPMSGRFRSLPEFPWPPPAGYSRFVVPRELFGPREGEATLGDVYNALVDALETASDGFEHGLFGGLPGGFALVARMERIRRDGTPLPEPARWMKKGSPKLSLVELLGDLFFERPGYFRVIAFAVTDDLMPGEDPGARLPEPEEGAPTIPPELAEKPFDNQEVLAIIYSFERRDDAKVTPWRDGAPSARQHLKSAGVWTPLEDS